MQRKKLTPEQQKKRDEKREKRAARPFEAAVAAAPTLGDIIARQQLVHTISKSTRKMIGDTEVLVDELGKKRLRVASCHSCDEPGCCSQRVAAYLHEVVPLVDRLRREGRDTPELRAALATAAELMETPGDYRRPCVFLEAKRCSVYTDRPLECGTTFVFSPPALCSGSSTTEVEKFPPELGDAPRKMEQRFEREARLVPLQGLYLGTLPRMTLLCLEAWDRTDYAQHLAEQMPLIAKRMVAVLR